MNDQVFSNTVLPVKPPSLRRSYKALCNHCKSITTCLNNERAVVCHLCIPLNVQKRSSAIITKVYQEYLEKKKEKLI